jgi:hypothetical protein
MLKTDSPLRQKCRKLLIAVLGEFYLNRLSLVHRDRNACQDANDGNYNQQLNPPLP